MSAVTAAIVTSTILRRQRSLVARFTAAGATSADRAVTLAEAGVEPDACFRALAARGVFVHTSSDDRWHVDLAAWQHFQSARNLRLLAAAAIIIAAALVFLAVWSRL